MKWEADISVKPAPTNRESRGIPVNRETLDLFALTHSPDYPDTICNLVDLIKLFSNQNPILVENQVYRLIAATSTDTLLKNREEFGEALRSQQSNFLRDYNDMEPRFLLIF